MRPLEGVRLLDISRLGPGTMTSQILGDFGADVIKVETPLSASERDRGMGASPIETEGTREVAYDVLNRNKRSIALNMKDEKGKQIFYKLATKADVIIEGYRPGVAKRLGIDYHTISTFNPQIIYCSITGYGQTGPYNQLPGHDINYISMAGILGIIGQKNGPPVIPSNIVADWAGGSLPAALGILMALIARQKTGRGQFIDISLVDQVIALQALLTPEYFKQGAIPRRGESALTGGYPYYNVYETKDGGYISIGCVEPWFWNSLCKAIGREDLLPYHVENAHLFAPAHDEKWDRAIQSLKEVFLTKTRDEWFEELKAKDIPIGKVYSMNETLSDPQVMEHRMVVEIGHPTLGNVKQTGIPIRMSDTPGEIRSFAPMLGEHTDEILKELGYSNREVSELRQVGALG